MGEAGASLEAKQAAVLPARPDTTQSYTRKLHGQANQHTGSIAQRTTETQQNNGLFGKRVFKELLMDWTIGFTALSAIGAAVAAGAAAWQISVARKAISAQSFLNLHQLEVSTRKDGVDGIAAIAALKRYDNYTAFKQEVPENEQDAIYNAVAFLNFIATLSEEGYLKVQDAWDIYFMAYRISYDKLWPWWLEYQRESHRNIFPSFERTCLVTHVITSEMSDTYDRKRHLHYIKRYKRASKLRKEQLDGVFKQLGILRSLPSKVIIQPPPVPSLEHDGTMNTQRVERAE